MAYNVLSGSWVSRRQPQGSASRLRLTRLATNGTFCVELDGLIPTRSSDEPIAFSQLQLRIALLTTASNLRKLGSEIDALRKRCGADEDISLDPEHFLAGTSRERRPCAVACWDEDVLVGLVYCTEHWERGWQTGYAVGGDFTGRGLLLCKAEHEPAILGAAVPCIVAHGVHSLHLRRVPQTTAPARFPGLVVKQRNAMITGDRMPLGSSYDDFLRSLGQHTRRNLRYYRRKASEAGIHFDPQVGPADFKLQLEELNVRSHFSAKTSHVERDDRLMALYGGGLRVALRGGDGRAVALLCGFRVAERFYVLTQWNDRSLGRLSLSNVLRGHLVEYLIQAGCRELVFVGGTSLSFGRFCAPQPFELLLLDREKGLPAFLKRLFAHFCRGCAHAGKPVPFSLEGLAGGFLGEERLIERTALGHSVDLTHGESAGVGSNTFPDPVT